VDDVVGTIVWLNGTDISPGGLYDRPEHVADAIARRRRDRWLAEEAVVEV
jgi:hypothetical protein